MFLSAMFLVVLILLQALPTPVGEQVFTALVPLVVFFATMAVRYITPGKIPGWIVISVVVPLLSALVTYLATLLSSDLSFTLYFILGLLSVFIREFLHQLKQIFDENKNG
jgi:hypothetical protein